MQRPHSIAVVGSGIAGLSAAWLLSQRHRVTLFEAAARVGGHSHTVEAPGRCGSVAVDTGFIVYNPRSYPNLVALFEHLGVATAATEMSFAVSLDQGGYEYAGSSLATLFGQPSCLLDPSHWAMLRDALRFFREAPGLLEPSRLECGRSLGAFLRDERYSRAFIDRHILPMAAAIWSTPSDRVMDMPAAMFVRFFANHGLLQVRNRPQWRTVVGGSREYVRRMSAEIGPHVRSGEPVERIVRSSEGVQVSTARDTTAFDDVVVATHADDALAILADADADERAVLGSFRYVANHAVLHRDPAQMPIRRRLWSSWNYLGRGGGRGTDLSVTYWMNKLQPLGPDVGDLFVTLNPSQPIASADVVQEIGYTHPILDARAMAAQREIWRLQGRRGTWFAGAHLGFGFHEDGLQSGLWVAEAIGGVRRPWQVPGESDRLALGAGRTERLAADFLEATA